MLHILTTTYVFSLSNFNHSNHHVIVGHSDFNFHLLDNSQSRGSFHVIRILWLGILVRHYFANKGPSSQGYGFSSGHVWMWELDCELSWAPKNRCFWTVVLEKTLESPMDCSLPGSSAHEIFQARVLEWVAIAFSIIMAEWYPNVHCSTVHNSQDMETT